MTIVGMTLRGLLFTDNCVSCAGCVGEVSGHWLCKSDQSNHRRICKAEVAMSYKCKINSIAESGRFIE